MLYNSGDAVMLYLDQSQYSGAIIKVIGIGAIGCNSVVHMINSNDIEGVDFICADTDSKSLAKVKSCNVLQFSDDITKDYAEEQAHQSDINSAIKDELHHTAVLKDVDLLFIVADMADMVGAIIAPVIAGMASESGIFTIALVSDSSLSDSCKQPVYASEALFQLSRKVNAYILSPDSQSLPLRRKHKDFNNNFENSNDLQLTVVRSIADLIIRPSIIGMDYADIKCVMWDMGFAMVSQASANGLNRANEAVQAAIHSLLFVSSDFKSAKDILVNITANESLQPKELGVVIDALGECFTGDGTRVIGCVLDPKLKDKLRVTIITGGNF
jgi:cell division protein FtsZ